MVNRTGFKCKDYDLLSRQTGILDQWSITTTTEYY